MSITPDEAAPVATPESGEAEELVAWLIEMRDHGVIEVASAYDRKLTRVIALLQHPPVPQPAPPPAPAGGLVERVAELREKFEQLIKCSRAYDGYSTMTPVELADRLIDAVLKLEAG